MSYCSAISKVYKDAGIQDIMIESDIVAAGSINGVLSGKHYNCSVRVHKLIYEAMQRLRLKSFISSLPEDETCNFNFNLLAVKLHDSVDNGNFEETCDSETVSYFERSYNEFVGERSMQSPTFAFWSNYIEMIQLLLLYIRATRTSDWELHLSVLRSMIPWFFAKDRVNYARYAPCYWLEMMSFENTHPYIAANIKDNWTIQRQDSYGFSSIVCDQTIEQTLNRDSKMKMDW
eukprot:gene20892-22943_t